MKNSFSQWMTLVSLEILKTRRSLALLMMFLSPLAVLFVNLMLLFNNEGQAVAKNGWGIFWAGNYAMWGYFMLPLYIALITALLNGIEHKVGGWRLMLSFPVSQMALFTAKFVLAWLYVLGASIIFFLMVLLCVLVLNSVGYEGENLLAAEFSFKLVYSLLACCGILMIQHIVSWRWANIVAPLTLGVVATMSIVQAGQSRFWQYDPWTYVLMSTNTPDVQIRWLVIVLSVSLTIVGGLVARYWLGQREITC